MDIWTKTWRSCIYSGRMPAPSQESQGKKFLIIFLLGFAFLNTRTTWSCLSYSFHLHAVVYESCCGLRLPRKCRRMPSSNQGVQTSSKEPQSQRRQTWSIPCFHKTKMLCAWDIFFFRIYFTNPHFFFNSFFLVPLCFLSRSRKWYFMQLRKQLKTQTVWYLLWIESCPMEMEATLPFTAKVTLAFMDLQKSEHWQNL